MPIPNAGTRWPGDPGTWDHQDWEQGTWHILNGHPGWVPRGVVAPVFNVKDYGAIGNWNGATGADDTAAIQATIATAGVGTVYFPTSSGGYKISASLVPTAGQRWFGGSRFDRFNSPSPSPRIVSATGFNAPIIDAGTVADVTISGLSFLGDPISGSKGIHATSASGWHVKHCNFDTFGDQAIQIDAGSASIFENIWIENALLVRTGRAAYVGGFDLAGDDHRVDYCTSTVSMPFAYGQGTGFLAGIVIRGQVCFISFCVGHLSHVGIVSPSGGNNRFVGCRADLNQGHGFLVTSAASGNDFIGCMGWRNSYNANAASDHFNIQGGQNSFIGCRGDTLAGDTNKVGYGFNDSTSVGAGAAIANMYVGCRANNWVTGEYNLSGASESGWLGLSGRSSKASGSYIGGYKSLAFTVNIDTDASSASFFTMVATNATAFTFNTPLLPKQGQTITYDIKNSSGGAMGVVTWGAAFKLAGAFVNPANTFRRTISFYYDGTNWVETTRAAADI